MEKQGGYSKQSGRLDSSTEVGTGMQPVGTRRLFGARRDRNGTGLTGGALDKIHL